MTEPIRLAKRVAELRACSRREAEQFIAGGWVRVDGIVIEEPQFRVTDQRIEIDPRADLAQAEPVTLLLHKPPGYLTIEGDKPASQLLTPTTLWAEDLSGLRP
ncbi:MAG: S4 domain-containing protein, partial [Thiobacillus sp.]|nr:S4 domain-containing protein [Thiobacillus sp.]